MYGRQVGIMRHYGSGLTVHKCISHAMKIDDACWLLEIVADLPMSVQNLLDPQLAMHGFQVIQCSRLALQLCTSEASTTAVLVPPMLCCCHLLMVTLPPIILLAGLPRIIAGRANSCPHCGHFRSPFVMSSTILSMKHLTKDPLPPCKVSLVFRSNTGVCQHSSQTIQCMLLH